MEITNEGTENNQHSAAEKNRQQANRVVLHPAQSRPLGALGSAHHGANHQQAERRQAHRHRLCAWKQTNPSRLVEAFREYAKTVHVSTSEIDEHAGAGRNPNTSVTRAGKGRDSAGMRHARPRPLQHHAIHERSTAETRHEETGLATECENAKRVARSERVQQGHRARGDTSQ
jgi:hypothetical protein